MTYRFIFLFALLALALITNGCMLLGEPLPEPDVFPARQTQDLLDEEDELDRVAEEADQLTQNDLGYWEALFANEEDEENGIKMIFVPMGTFTMGNNALHEEVTGIPAAPAHQVTLDHYWIAKTPVTIGQFRRFVDETGYITTVELEGHPGPWVYDFDSQGFITKEGYHWDNAFQDVTARFPELTVTDAHPVNNVSWYDCIAYTNWLSDQYDLQFTLPSEAEWEYAARGSDGRIYPWGNDHPDGTRANYADETFDRYFPNTGQSIVHIGVDDGYAITSPVGRFPNGRSPIGALDMAGNLTEWVFDSYVSYERGAVLNPIYPEGEEDIKMQKAGFWAGSAGRFNQIPDEIEDGHNIRADARQGDDPASADDHLGCRIAISYTDRE